MMKAMPEPRPRRQFDNGRKNGEQKHAQQPVEQQEGPDDAEKEEPMEPVSDVVGDTNDLQQPIEPDNIASEA